MQKPSIPKGTRDFTPAEATRRQYIFDTIKKVFNEYGYSPIETPAMENLSTLLGKYGDEGDKLLYRMLNSGDFLSKTDRTKLKEISSNELSTQISNKGLRYDLTVPFARFVVQNRDKITFPFKRYQIQPVWRADRPQKGRYREFYQCDADIIGSRSLVNEVEFVQLIKEVFSRLGIQITIKLNNRKILAGIAESIGLSDKLIDITVALDKLDKIGKEKVLDELRSKNIDENNIEKLEPYLEAKESGQNLLGFLSDKLSSSETGKKGIEEINETFKMLDELDSLEDVELDITLARGLNYYTGAIIEVKANDVQIGSICGGGRYDDLTGVFGLKDVSGVGISFGADRIYDVMLQLNNFPDAIEQACQAMIIRFDEQQTIYALRLLYKLRRQNIRSILYPEATKLKKQMTYANANAIPFVILIGEEEVSSGNYTLKNMESGIQERVNDIELIKRLQAI